MSKVLEYIDQAKTTIPKKTAVTFREGNTYQSYDYETFKHKIDALAYALKDHKDQTIAILGYNKIEMLTSLLAVIGTIGHAFLVDRELNKEELDALFLKVRPSLILVDDALEYQSETITCMSFSKVRAAMDGEMTYVREGFAGDLILHTSGTTGTPKCIRLTQRNYLYIVQELNRAWKVTGEHSCFFLIPLYHIYALTSLFHSLYAHCAIILEWDPSRLAQALSATGPSIFLGVPLIFRRLYQTVNPQRIPASGLSPEEKRMLHDRVNAYFGGNHFFSVSGGSIAEPEVMSFFHEIGIPVYNGYGMTETSGPIAITYDAYNNVHATGRVLKNEIRIKDPKEDGEGEILVRGDNVFSGYMGEETNVLQDGYYNTKDLGYLKDGYLFVTGRKKNVLIGENGKNISEKELSDRILKNDKIKDCSIKMQDNRLIAILDTTLSEKQAQQYIDKINADLPRYKQIYAVRVLRKGLT